MTPSLPTATKALESTLEALRFDALAEAEKITGESYKTDRATELLGFGMHIGAVQKKRELMEAIGDTCFTRTAARACSPGSRGWSRTGNSLRPGASSRSYGF